MGGGEQASRKTAGQSLNSLLFGLSETNFEAGRTLVSDRYAHSGLVYSIARNDGTEEAWMKAADMGLPAPDLVLFLKGSSGEGQPRPDFGSERLETKPFQVKLFLSMVSLHHSWF